MRPARALALPYYYGWKGSCQLSDLSYQQEKFPSTRNCCRDSASKLSLCAPVWSASLRNRTIRYYKRGLPGPDENIYGLTDFRIVEFPPILQFVNSAIRKSHVFCRHLRPQDRKSTRLNSSHVAISYAVF